MCLYLLLLLPHVLAHVEADADYYWYAYDSTEEDDCPKRNFSFACRPRYRDELDETTWKGREAFLRLVGQVIVNEEGSTKDHRDFRLAISEILLY